MNSYHGRKIYIHQFLAAHACIHTYVHTHITYMYTSKHR